MTILPVYLPVKKKEDFLGQPFLGPSYEQISRLSLNSAVQSIGALSKPAVANFYNIATIIPKPPTYDFTAKNTTSLLDLYKLQLIHRHRDFNSAVVQKPFEISRVQVVPVFQFDYTGRSLHCTWYQFLDETAFTRDKKKKIKMTSS